MLPRVLHAAGAVRHGVNQRNRARGAPRHNERNRMDAVPHGRRGGRRRACAGDVGARHAGESAAADTHPVLVTRLTPSTTQGQRSARSRGLAL
jgi:hypothetical protein